LVHGRPFPLLALTPPPTWHIAMPSGGASTPSVTHRLHLVSLVTHRLHLVSLHRLEKFQDLLLAKLLVQTFVPDSLQEAGIEDVLHDLAAIVGSHHD